MSILIDSIMKEVWTDSAQDNGDQKWYLAKPLNYDKEYTSFISRIKDAWRVFQCKSIAVHYKSDEY